MEVESTDQKPAPGKRDRGCYVYLALLVLMGLGVARIVSTAARNNHDYAKYFTSGDDARDRGDYITALRYYRQEEKLHPENAYIHHSIAEVLLKQGDVLGARSELREAIDATDRREETERDAWTAEVEAIDKSR